MTIGEKIKYLVQESGMTAEEVADSLGVSVSSLVEYYKKDNFCTSTLEQIAPVFNVDVTYFFTKTAKNKTAVGNQSVAGNKNVVAGNYSVSLPPEGYVKIVSADGSVQEVTAASSGYERKLPLTTVSKELEEKKNELIYLQCRIIELQNNIIELTR